MVYPAAELPFITGIAVGATHDGYEPRRRAPQHAGGFKPIVATCSFDTNGRTMMGLTPADFVAFVHELDPKPLAYGANCGVGAPDLAVTITQLAAAARPGDVIVAKGNCGIPDDEEGHIRYNGTPELMAEYARVVRDAGAKIVGGCCGTSPEHLQALRNSPTITSRARCRRWTAS